MKKIEVRGNYGEVRWAKVDAEDYEWLSSKKWFLSRFGYAYTVLRRVKTTGKSTQQNIPMHRIVSMANSDQHTDHINGDRIDNRKSNLRVCTNQQNARNAKLRPLNTSGYKGVSWDKSSGRWRAYIKVDYKQLWLGYHHDKRDAARAYNNAAKRYFGEFARLNDVPV